MNSALRPIRVLLAALVFGLAACTAIESPRVASAPAASTSAAVCDRLFFGRTIPGGGEVSDEQWNAFVAAEITPRFPRGFTIYRADGHWRGDDGSPVNEKTIILEIIHTPDATSDRAVTDIARAYRTRFHQDAVMRIRTPAEQSFLRL